MCKGLPGGNKFEVKFWQKCEEFLNIYNTSASNLFYVQCGYDAYTCMLSTSSNNMNDLDSDCDAFLNA